MSNYKLIVMLEKLPYFNELLTEGIIPMNWIDYKVIYEFYCVEVERLKREGFSKSRARSTANTLTAEEYGISERTVYAIIVKMK